MNLNEMQVMDDHFDGKFRIIIKWNAENQSQTNAASTNKPVKNHAEYAKIENEKR